MKDISPTSNWNLPPTAKQCNAMARMGVKEDDMPTTRWEARRVIYELRRKMDASKK